VYYFQTNPPRIVFWGCFWATRSSIPQRTISAQRAEMAQFVQRQKKTGLIVFWKVCIPYNQDCRGFDSSGPLVASLSSKTGPTPTVPLRFQSAHRSVSQHQAQALPKGGTQIPTDPYRRLKQTQLASFFLKDLGMSFGDGTLTARALPNGGLGYAQSVGLTMTVMTHPK